MKNFFLFILLLCAKNLTAQKYDNTTLNRYGYKLYRLDADKSISIPTGCDTPAISSIDVVDYRKARLFYDTCGKQFWVYNPKKFQWQVPNLKYVKSPDGSVLLTQTLDTIFISTQVANNPNAGNYIVSAEPIEQSEDTVNVIPDIIFQMGAVRDTITTGEQYIVPFASAGTKRIDEIIVTAAGTLDTLKGVQDSNVFIPRTLPDGAILFAYINVYGTDSVVVVPVSTYQRTAVVYIGPDGKMKADSANGPVWDEVNKIFLTSVNGYAFHNNTGTPFIKVRGTSGFWAKDHADRTIIRSSPLTGNVAIGHDSPAASALLDVASTTKGVRFPVQTGTQMNAVSSPVAGLIVYNSDSASLCLYNGSAWVKLGTGGGSGTPAWYLTGNSGTDSTINGVGTNNLQPLYIRVNGDTTAKFGTLYNFQTGKDTWAGGYASVAMGEGSFATGNRSFAAGFGSYATGYASIAMGIGGTTASGENSIAIGNSAVADNVNSTAIGSNASSTGEDATAIGVTAMASGQNTGAFGYGANASATGSTAIGNGAITTLENSTVIGAGVTVTIDSTIISNDIKFEGNGTPGTGKIATGTDANGNWTWQTPAGGSLTRGTTTISSGTTTRVLYDSSGIVGEYAISGSGSVAMTNSTTLTTPVLGVATGTSLALGSSLSSSAILDITSTTKAVYMPRMTTSQMNAISSPSDGAEIYNTDEKAKFIYNSDWGWEANNLRYRTKFGTEYFNDFIGPISGSSDLNLIAATSSGAIASTVPTDAKRTGIINLSTSTSSTGRAYVSSSSGTTAQNLLLGGGRILYEVSLRVPTLSTSGERFQFIAGLTSVNNSTTMSNGVAFLYDEGGISTGSAASANWQVCTAASSSRTYTTTSVAVTANQWYKLTAIINAAGTSVSFYIDDALVRTETATIPTVSLGVVNQIVKSAGTTARTADIDYVYFKQKYTTTK